MTTFVQGLDDDLNHEVVGIIKDVKKIFKAENKLSKYSKSQCVEDIVELSIGRDRKELINEIIALRRKKGISISKK